jgi:hypothetical protein
MLHHVIKQVPERACDGAVFELSAAEDGCAAAERGVGDQAYDKALPVDDGPRGRGDGAGQGGGATLGAGGDGLTASDEGMSSHVLDVLGWRHRRRPVRLCKIADLEEGDRCRCSYQSLVGLPNRTS